MANITRYYQTKNDCYKKGGTMTPVPEQIKNAVDVLKGKSN